MRVGDEHPRRVVLIGAARSGTKIMRDTLAEATGAGAVPYDIGYVWRYGSLDHPDDVLDPAGLTPRSRRFISSFIDKYAGRSGTVIEKTVGNALRVPYVASVLPNAIYVHLIRDGVDVSESTLRQWRNPADYRYLVHKLRHFPLRMIPSHGLRYATSVLRRKVAGDGRVATWGTRYPGIAIDLQEQDLLTVCARQWSESVVRARRDFGVLGVPVVEVRYEDLVAHPEDELARVSRFCGLSSTAESLARAASRISPGRAGHGGHTLTLAETGRVDAEIGPLLSELGYGRPDVERRR